MLHRTTLPILSTVLLRASDCELEITATDLDRLFKATIEARIEVEGLIAINASLLAGFVRDAVGRDVELALAASLLELRSGRARCCIPTLTAADFVEPFRDGEAKSASRSTVPCWPIASTASATRYRRKTPATICSA